MNVTTDAKGHFPETPPKHNEGKVGKRTYCIDCGAIMPKGGWRMECKPVPPDRRYIGG